MRTLQPPVAGVNSIPEPDDRSAAVNAMDTESQNSQVPRGPCFRCGGRHPSLTCTCKTWLCNSCGKKGHVARVCRSRSSARTTSKQKKQEVDRPARNESSPEQVHTLFYVKHRPHPPLTLTVRLNEAKLSMEVDTGAAVSLISDTTFKGL